MLTRIAIATLLFSTCCQQGFAGEVYRWVDENGKVHFSDNTNKSLIEQKKKQVIEAEAIALKPVNSADPADSFSDYYRNDKDAEYKKQLANEQAQQQAQAERDYQKSNCDHWLATYNSYGNRHNTITYMVDDNGKALTEKQQQNELDKMHKQLKALGCL
jgi:cytochrome oxidase Cu insertion factor (SCO1/SenC/PrrC family)